MSLLEIAMRHGTDKATVHSYIDVYEQYLSAFRNETFEMLEIGIACGASLRMWLEYFPYATVRGIDNSASAITSQCSHSRLKLLQVDQSDRSSLNCWIPNCSLRFVVDDGSHRPEDQILSLCWLWPKLAPGSLYFIEDIGANGYSKEPNLLSYFGAFGGKIYSICKHGRKDDVLFVVRKP